MKHRAKYLTDVPYLKHMTFDQRKNICQGSKYQNYNRNQMVVQEGAHLEHVFIIMQGEFETQIKHKELTINSPAMKIMAKKPK